MQEFPIWLPLVFFPFFFVGLWALVLRLIAAFGWDALARRYAATGAVPPGARSFSMQSAQIGRSLIGPASYSNWLNVWLDGTSLFLRPGFPLTVFHPLLRIPLADIRKVEQRNWLWRKGCAITLDHDVPPITLYGASSAALLAAKSGTPVQPR